MTHLAGELFKQLTKTPDILHVPYRGAGPGLIDLIAGAVPMMTPNVTSQVLEFPPRRRFAHSRGLRASAAQGRARHSRGGRDPSGARRGAHLRRTGAGGNAAADHRSNLRGDRAVIRQPDFDEALRAAGLEAQSRRQSGRGAGISGRRSGNV